MTVWGSGRESELLDDIIAGRKTIEGRLNKGKFAEYRVDDVVRLRRDARDEQGILRDGTPDAARVKIVAIRKYPDFLAMVEAEGYNKVIPSAESAEVAAAEYDRYYSAEDQARYGVLAIEIVPLIGSAGWDKTYRAGVDYTQLSDMDVAGLSSYLPTSTPRTALDVGCGTGRLVRQLQQIGFRTVGVDPSEEAIARARQKDPTGSYFVGDISIVEEVFGVITCKLVYAFIEDKEQFLRAVARRLDPRGFFIVLAPTHGHPINHKKAIHVDRETMYRQLRAEFRIVHKQQTKLGVLVICRPR